MQQRIEKRFDASIHYVRPHERQAHRKWREEMYAGFIKKIEATESRPVPGIPLLREMRPISPRPGGWRPNEFKITR